MNDNPKTEKEVIYVPLPNMEMTEQDDEIDLIELWNILWQRKWFIAGFTLACTLVAVYVTLNVLPKTYRSDVVLHPTETSQQSGLASLAASLPISLPIGGGSGKSANIVSFLNSRTIKERLTEKYDLLQIFYSAIWDKESQTWMVEDPKGKPTLRNAVNHLANLYTVNSDKKTGLITVTFISEDPEFTKIMLERIVKEVSYYFENEYDSDAKQERQFVEKQLAKAENELDFWKNRYLQAS